MTIEEFTNGSVVHGVFSVAIRNHKMFLWLGPALVGFFLPNLKEAIAHYMAIFKSHVPPNKPLKAQDFLTASIRLIFPGFTTRGQRVSNTYYLSFLVKGVQ